MFACSSVRIVNFPPVNCLSCFYNNSQNVSPEERSPEDWLSPEKRSGDGWLLRRRLGDLQC